MTISVAMVGAGRMGAAHARNLARFDDVRIVGVADARREAAEGLAAEYGPGAAIETDYRELLERTRPDAVYFCTPPFGHRAQVEFAAERGINVFVEKPLATTMADATATAAVVERAGILCTVGYHWRYHPAIDAAREALGDLPLTLLAGWWYWTIPPIPWIRDRRSAGGQIYEQATHLVDAMRFVAGDVTSVYAAYAQNAVPFSELPNWDANAVTLGFAGGAAGSLHTTYALFPGIPDSVGLDLIARELLVRVNLQGATVFRRDQGPEAIVTAPEWSVEDAWVPVLRRNDAAAIRATAREAAASIAVSLAANYSAVTGKVVDVAAFMADPPTDAPIEPTLDVADVLPAAG